MKKQVVSFFALFGLVLVLSVYYVLLPTNLFISNRGGNSIPVGFTIDEASNKYFTELYLKLEEKHDKIISSSEQIVASSSVLNEEKEIALNTIANEKTIMNNETMLASLIKETGYVNAYVEYQDDIIKVVVQASGLTSVEAAEIMTLVMNNSCFKLTPEIQYVS